MTVIPLKDDFAEARDRFMAIVKIAMPPIVQVTAYTATQLITPYAEIVVPALTLADLNSGRQDITINPEVRITCGDALEGSDGVLQNIIFFDWLPSITQSFIEHSNLCYEAKQSPIGRLDKQRSGFQRAQAILTPPSQDAGSQWLLVFYWQLVFITGFKKKFGF